MSRSTKNEANLWFFFHFAPWSNLIMFNESDYIPATVSTRSIHPEVFLVKGVLKTCSRFTGERPCQSAILKSHFDMGVLQYISCIFSEHLVIRTPLGGCFCSTHLDMANRPFSVNSHTETGRTVNVRSTGVNSLNEAINRKQWL